VKISPKGTFLFEGGMEYVTILAENQGSIKLAENDSTSKRTKHIDNRYHFTKNAMLDK
jgi:hypothetical protein